MPIVWHFCFIVSSAHAKVPSAQEVAPDGVVHTVPTDVTDGHRLRVILDYVEEAYGPIDVAICNAGRGCAKLLVNQTLEEAQEVMQVRAMHVKLQPGATTGHSCCCTRQGFVCAVVACARRSRSPC